VPLGDLGRIDAEEPVAELGGVVGEGDGGVAVADPLYGGEGGARGGGVGEGQEKGVQAEKE
jgi:hypothetical protein